MARRESFSPERQTFILYLIAKIREVDHPRPFGMLRSVNAPPPASQPHQSGKPTIFLPPRLFLPRISTGVPSFPSLLVRCFWCSPTSGRIRSVENVVVDGDVDSHLLFLRPVSSFSLLSPPLFSTSVLLLLYIGEPPLNSLGH